MEGIKKKYKEMMEGYKSTKQECERKKGINIQTKLFPLKFQ
jgi:hypothetical protein